MDKVGQTERTRVLYSTGFYSQQRPVGLTVTLTWPQRCLKTLTGS